MKKYMVAQHDALIQKEKLVLVSQLIFNWLKLVND